MEKLEVPPLAKPWVQLNPHVKIVDLRSYKSRASIPQAPQREEILRTTKLSVLRVCRIHVRLNVCNSSQKKTIHVEHNHQAIPVLCDNGWVKVTKHDSYSGKNMRNSPRLQSVHLIREKISSWRPLTIADPAWKPSVESSLEKQPSSVPQCCLQSWPWSIEHDKFYGVICSIRPQSGGNAPIEIGKGNGEKNSEYGAHDHDGTTAYNTEPRIAIESTPRGIDMILWRTIANFSTVNLLLLCAEGGIDFGGWGFFGS